MRFTWLTVGLIGIVILTAILFLRTSKETRDTSSVEVSIQGHWLAGNGDHLYYGPDQAIALSPEGTKSYHPYRVLLSNEKESWMKILIANSEGNEVERVIRFNANRDAYQTTSVILLGSGRTERFATLEYVDNNKRP
ncbi:MAG: hypothetical protein KKB70_06505 [Proteobacteria bacterium]|nr:hypothetical protein [Pseudomonadota bacterium]MBU1610292.1 hypothetical protein [Pseudomonadota bacterium]